MTDSTSQSVPTALGRSWSASKPHPRGSQRARRPGQEPVVLDRLADQEVFALPGSLWLLGVESTTTTQAAKVLRCCRVRPLEGDGLDRRRRRPSPQADPHLKIHEGPGARAGVAVRRSLTGTAVGDAPIPPRITRLPQSPSRARRGLDLALEPLAGNESTTSAGTLSSSAGRTEFTRYPTAVIGWLSHDV